jgi:L-alanine-DL-glutamate epimerase-like enolase superfamily enzyme
MGGIAEMKWVSEFADLYSIQFAPHGTFDGLIEWQHRLWQEQQCRKTISRSNTAIANPAWWYDIVSGLPDPVVKGGLIDVWDKPGLGIEIDKKAAKQYLAEEDKNFFD